MVKVSRRNHLRKQKKIHRTRKRNIRRRVKKTQRKIKKRRRRSRRIRHKGGYGRDPIGSWAGTRIREHVCNEIVPFSVNGPPEDPITGDLQKAVKSELNAPQIKICKQNGALKENYKPLTENERITIGTLFENDFFIKR